jgi:hypothetical protein
LSSPPAGGSACCAICGAGISSTRASGFSRCTGPSMVIVIGRRRPHESTSIWLTRPLDFLELPVWNLLHPVNSQQGLIMRFPRNFQRFLMSYASVDALASPDALTKGTISLNGGLVSAPLLRSLEASEEDGIHCESHPQTEDTFYQRRHGTSDRELI